MPPTVYNRWMKVTPPKMPGPALSTALSNSQGMASGTGQRFSTASDNQPGVAAAPAAVESLAINGSAGAHGFGSDNFTASGAVAGLPADTADWAAAGALAAARVRPEDDIHATAAYRRHLVAVLTARAGKAAVANA